MNDCGVEDFDFEYGKLFVDFCITQSLISYMCVCVCQDMQKMPLITFDMEYTSANLSSQQSNLKYF